jgi:Outer membrane protein beta-barrel domain
MKKIVFVLALISFSITAFTQSEDTTDTKRMKFGYNIAPNISKILAKEMIPENASIENGLGYRIGFFADYKVSKLFSIPPELDWSFNGGGVVFTDSKGSQTENLVMPISLDFMVHLILKKNNEKLSPYFLLGPNVKFPISKKPVTSTQFYTSSDLAINVGLGIDKAFPYFNFSPELRYSFGLFNVNQHPLIHSLNLHNISLVLNFIKS